MPLEYDASRFRPLVIRGIFAAVAFALIAIVPMPAGAQTDAAAAPPPEAAGPPRTMSEFFQRWARPQNAEPSAPQAQPDAAPAVQAKRPRRQARSNARKSRMRTAKAVQTAPPAPQDVQDKPQVLAADAVDWPEAESHSNTYDLTPYRVQTVREMVEAELAELEAAALASAVAAPQSVVAARADAPLHAQDLSPLDLAADARTALSARASTDGRAGSDAEPQRLPAASLSAFAQDFDTPSTAYWFEAMLLMLAGAIAGFSAWRFFVVR
jgi:hypothetical protein